MKLSEVANEFANVDSGNDKVNLKYLFRRQQAKCHVVALFIHQLARHFPDWWKQEGYTFWGDHPTKEWDVTDSTKFGSFISNWRLPPPGSMINSKEVRSEFRTKYQAMRDAKRAYENIGGEY